MWRKTYSTKNRGQEERPSPINVAKLFKQGKIKYAMYNSITTTERLESLIKNKKIIANSPPPHRVQKKKKCSNEITGSNTTKKT